MELSIREMRECDFGRVTALWNQELGNRGVNEENLTACYEKMRRDDNYRTFVAAADGETVGFITVVQVMAVEMPVGYLKVNGLAVRKEWQRQGIGAKLLSYAESYAAGRGLSSMILNSGFQRTGAHAFYERQQYDKLSYCFTKRIKREG
ncbi:MAG: GNAT family N-acetyltransferase [Clostridiaceae bacterium]|nr:GNAT family N-acetyltransferase [Clostridiaceae bacterium]